MMKGFFLTLFAVMAMAVLSCGGDETTDPVASDEPRIGLKLLAGECNVDGAGDYIDGGNIAERLGSLAIQFYKEDGTIVKVNNKNAVSLTASDLSEEVTVKGIPTISNARVVFSGFEVGNISSPKWRGEARGIDFAKGKETVVSVVLYPVSGLGCFPTPLLVPRFGHTVTELPDGRILVAGGFSGLSNGNWQATDSVELIDPESGTIDQIASMKNFRAFHIAALLPDGRIIFTGGITVLENKKMEVTDYPQMPLTFTSPANGVELYTVDLPKVNERPRDKNGDVVTTDNSAVEFIDLTDDKFFPFQSYAYVRSDETTGAGTIFMAGGVKEGAAVSSIYGIEISVADTVTVVINEYYTDKPLVAPMMAAAGTDKVLILGGHKSSDTKFAYLVSSSSYDEWTGGTAPNLFLGAISSYLGDPNDPNDDVIVAASGLELPNGAGGFSMNGKSYKFGVALSAQSEGPLFWGTWLHDIVLNAADGYFTVIGGTSNSDITQAAVEANNFLEHVSLDSMDFNVHQSYDYFKVKRLLHRTVGAGGKMYLIGGIEDLKGTALVGTIELMQMNKPWE